MWHPITYSCGHTDRIQIYGKESGRPRIAEREAQRLCPACRNACALAEREAATLAARNQAIAMNLPDLTGSPAQINWALCIRSATIPNLATLAASDSPEVQEFCRRILRQPDASYWIDRRSAFATPTSLESYITSRLAAESRKAIGLANLTGATS